MGRTHVHTKPEPAFVLNRRPYRETSLLVEAFTEGFGRIGLVAKGARRGKMPLAAVLQPFHPLLLLWRGSGELFTLTLAEPDGVSFLPRDPRIKSGFYVNELLLRLFHRHDPHPDLFADYRQVLTQITIPGQEESALRVFEKRLLAAIGYGISPDLDAGTGLPVEAEKNYYYQPDRGFVEQNGRSFSGISVRGSTLMAFAKETLQEPEQLRETKALMRVILRRYLGERPLASRMLYR